MRAEVVLLTLMLAALCYGCRIGGYVLMRWVPLTPRVQSWLGSMPMALMGAILAPVAVEGGPAEIGGLLAAALMMRVTGNEFVAAMCGVGVVAALRAVL
ncbi:MAG: AzlD family protein [Burkholderiaceae bacterium]